MPASGVTSNWLTVVLLSCCPVAHVVSCLSACVFVLLWRRDSVDFNLTVYDVEISHCRHICPCVLTNSIFHPSPDIFMVWLRAMFHSLNAALVSCSHYADWRVSLRRMLDAQTLPSAAAHRCAALVSYGMLSVVCPSSQPRAMGLPEISGRSYRVWSPSSTLQTQMFTLTPLHSCTLAQLRTDSTTASYGYCCLARRKESKLNPEMLCFRFRNAEPTDTTFWNLLRSLTNMYDAHSCQGVVEFFWDSCWVWLESSYVIASGWVWYFDLSFISSVNCRYYVTW